MSQSRRLRVAVLGLVSCLLGVSTGSMAAMTELTALISGDQGYIENIRQVFDAFEAENPDINITILPTGSCEPRLER